MTIKSIAAEIRIVSISCFWAQLILGGVPIAWLFISLIYRNSNTQQSRVSSGLTWFMALLALIALVFSIVWWYRQQREARLIPDRDLRPRRADVVRSLQTGFVVNLVGMALLVIAALSYAWVLFVGVMTNPQGSVLLQPNALVPRPIFTQLDALSILAIIHTVAAQLIGIVGYVWLLKRVSEYGTVPIQHESLYDEVP